MRKGKGGETVDASFPLLHFPRAWLLRRCVAHSLASVHQSQSARPNLATHSSRRGKRNWKSNLTPSYTHFADTLLLLRHRAHAAEEVYVTGTFDQWTKSEKLEKVGDHFEKTVRLPDATKKIYYKVGAHYALHCALGTSERWTPVVCPRLELSPISNRFSPSPQPIILLFLPSSRSPSLAGRSHGATLPEWLQVLRPAASGTPRALPLRAPCFSPRTHCAEPPLPKRRARQTRVAPLAIVARESSALTAARCGPHGPSAVSHFSSSCSRSAPPMARLTRVGTVSWGFGLVRARPLSSHRPFRARMTQRQKRHPFGKPLAGRLAF
jgi:AMP-activated protein kinase-like protein